VPPEPESGVIYRLTSRATGFSVCGVLELQSEDAPTVFAMERDDPMPVPNIEFNFDFVTRWMLERTHIGFHLRHMGSEHLGRFLLDSNLERQVYMKRDNGGSFQKWLLVDGDDENFWSVVNLATGFALDGNLDRDIFTMRRNDGAFQRWKFERIEPPGHMDAAEVPTVVVTVHPGSLGHVTHG
jgi:hypothetical protein